MKCDPQPTYEPWDLIPITGPNARILTYGYDIHIRNWAGAPVNRNTVYDIAWDFLVDLDAIHRGELSRPLLFIVYSLGGIIMKETLRRSRGFEEYQSHLYNIYESTSNINFFGTSHGGADP
jgi:hypothetical protein